jgi:hypothetical protein
MATQQITVTVHYEPTDSRVAEAADGDGQRYRFVGITVADYQLTRGPLIRSGRAIPRALRRALVEAALAAEQE